MNFPTGHTLIELAVSLLPVFIFLLALVFLDSYKLVKLSKVITSIGAGCAAAAVAFGLNSLALFWLNDNITILTRYVGPVVEECLKIVFLYVMIRKGKVGFMVDAAIHGFAVGAGFALIENVYYLEMAQETSISTWIVRGFGTAVMHGGTASIFSIISKNLVDQSDRITMYRFLPGLLAAIVIHSFFNHFFLPPHIMTFLLVVTLPALMMLVFQRSEKSTREWLGVGFDTDAQLLDSIDTGVISGTKVGQYLHTLRSSFAGELVADMLCMLRIHLELSIRAKGILMMRQHGFSIKPEPDTKERFDELKYLEKSIGKTGMLAIKPFLHTSTRDLWQLYMIGKE